MPRYKVSMHQTGWQTLENFVDAKDEDEAWEKYNENGENVLVNKEWKIIEEEYSFIGSDNSLTNKPIAYKNNYSIKNPVLTDKFGKSEIEMEKFWLLTARCIKLLIKKSKIQSQ